MTNWDYEPCWAKGANMADWGHWLNIRKGLVMDELTWAKKAVLEFWLQNIEYAGEMWATIPKKNVSLSLWKKFRVDTCGSRLDQPLTCGTIACFGGWVVGMPVFAAMGVRSTEKGGPTIREDMVSPTKFPVLRKLVHDRGYPSATYGGVAQVLFGMAELFDSAWNGCDYDYAMAPGKYTGSDGLVSDHAIVAHRIARHAEVLRDVLATRRSKS